MSPPQSSPIGQYGWLTPICLYHSFNEPDDIGEFLQPDSAVQRFVFFVWDQGPDEILRWHLKARASRPQDGFHFLCNDASLSEKLATQGLSAHHISHNAFLDEDLYELSHRPQTARLYDAIYVARMNRFKRHALAKKIPRVLLLGSVVCPDDEEAYATELALEMPNATFTHGTQTWLQPAQVSERINQAHVGLILSAQEGGSYAATEYQLCGLPVASTYSTGGRDCWLNPKFSRVTEATPEAVAAATAELKSAGLDPIAIRSHAMDVIVTHRRRLFALGQSIYETIGNPNDFARDFYDGFRHKVASWRPMHEVAHDLV